VVSGTIINILTFLSEVSPSAIGIIPVRKVEKAFRKNAKKFFLTFPNLKMKFVGIHSIMNRVVNVYDPKICIVAVEKHKNNVPHVHIFIQFRKKTDVRNPRYFDHLIPGHHCNIAAVRDTHATLNYIVKDDNYCLYGVTEPGLRILLSGTSIALAEVCTAIAENPDINEIAIKFPCKFIHYHSGIDHLCQIHRSRKSNQIAKLDWSPIVNRLYGYSEPDECPISFVAERQNELLGWLVANFKPGISRKLRAPQLWLHGRTGCGKTRFLAFLAKYFRSFLIASDEHFYGGYNDYDVDFLYLDEFHGNKKLFFLNSLLGGEPMNMPFKGGQYCKRSNKPVVICSNLTPVQCYSNISLSRPMVWEAFLSRLEVIDATDLQLHAILAIIDRELPPQQADVLPGIQQVGDLASEARGRGDAGGQRPRTHVSGTPFSGTNTPDTSCEPNWSISPEPMHRPINSLTDDEITSITNKMNGSFFPSRKRKI